MDKKDPFIEFMEQILKELLKGNPNLESFGEVVAFGPDGVHRNMIGNTSPQLKIEFDLQAEFFIEDEKLLVLVDTKGFPLEDIYYGFNKDYTMFYLRHKDGSYVEFPIEEDLQVPWDIDNITTSCNNSVLSIWIERKSD